MDCRVGVGGRPGNGQDGGRGGWGGRIVQKQSDIKLYLVKIQNKLEDVFNTFESYQKCL